MKQGRIPGTTQRDHLGFEEGGPSLEFQEIKHLMGTTTHLVMWSCEGNLKVNMLRVSGQEQANMITYNQCYCVFFLSEICLAAFSTLEKL